MMFSTHQNDRRGGIIWITKGKYTICGVHNNGYCAFPINSSYDNIDLNNSGSLVIDGVDLV